MAYEAKTKPTKISVAAFIEAVPHEGRREDAKKLLKIMREVTGEKPVMWGPSIVGFGRYKYTYESGHSGEACRIGFSPRKANMVVYVLSGRAEERPLLARLGKHKTGKSCLYLGRLSEIDEGALRELIAMSDGWMREKYPA
jgi:hypothetical protein